MICERPFINEAGQLHGCGQCVPCRINRRRVWAHRIMLEALQHTDNSFVTLTYRENALPKTDNGLPTLSPKHLQLFMKKIRWYVRPIRLRYFAVGEYGETTQRPHYHLALFGYPTCLRGKTRHPASTCCTNCKLIQEGWEHGEIELDQLNDGTSGYVAGYVVKKLNKDHPDLRGRHPEYARMSRRPGLGSGMIEEMASVWLQYDYREVSEDVPGVLQHGSKKQPLGPFLKRLMRKKVGMDANAPIKNVLSIQEAQMQQMREAAGFTKEGYLIDGKEVTRRGSKKKLLELMAGTIEQKTLAVKAREQLFKKRHKL